MIDVLWLASPTVSEELEPPCTGQDIVARAALARGTTTDRRGILDCGGAG